MKLLPTMYKQQIGEKTMDITGLLFVAFFVIGKFFVKDEDIRRMEAEEIQEIRRDGNVPG